MLSFKIFDGGTSTVTPGNSMCPEILTIVFFSQTLTPRFLSADCTCYSCLLCPAHGAYVPSLLVVLVHWKLLLCHPSAFSFSDISAHGHSCFLLWSFPSAQIFAELQNYHFLQQYNITATCSVCKPLSSHVFCRTIQLFFFLYLYDYSYPMCQRFH